MAIINVLLFTSDTEYSHRLRRYIGDRHRDIKLTIVNNTDDLKTTTASIQSNVMLIGEEFAKTPVEVPNGTACGYLTAKDTGETINERKCFCKYRSGETLYSMILDLYSEVSANKASSSAGSAKIYAFTSANGGAGATTAAAALAMKLAMQSKKVLYISFDKYCLPSLWFDGEKRGDMSDFIFAVHASEKKNINLSVKAASLLIKDTTGVKYMEGCSKPADIEELSGEQLEKLFNSIASAEEFDAIAVDVPLSFDAVWNFIGPKSAKVFVMTENNSMANQKLTRYIQNVSIADSRNGTDFLEHTQIIMNKDKQHQEWAGGKFEGVTVAGAIPRYKDDNLRALLNAVCRAALWDNCL